MRFPIKITEQFLLEPVLHAFGVTGESSFVDLTPDTLEVQMGSWFHERIPLTEVTHFSRSEWPWWGGLGVKIHHHGLGLVGSTEGIVNVQLRGPRRVRAVLEVECRQLWLSLVDAEGFLREMARLTRLPVGEPTPF